MRHHQNWKDTADKLEALAARFQDGELSEAVYLASVHALGLRGDELYPTVREQLEKKYHGQKPAGIPRGRP